MTNQQCCCLGFTLSLHTRTHTHTSAYAQIHTHTHTVYHASSEADVLECEHSKEQSRNLLTDTHVHMCVHTHKRAHTYTQAAAPVPVQFFFALFLSLLLAVLCPPSFLTGWFHLNLIPTHLHTNSLTPHWFTRAHKRCTHTFLWASESMRQRVYHLKNLRLACFYLVPLFSTPVEVWHMPTDHLYHATLS